MNLPQRGLVVVRVDLDLVGSRNHVDLRDEQVEVGGTEVRHADRSNAPLRIQPLQAFVRGDGRVEVLREGLVKKVEVDRVEPQLASAHIKCV